MDPKPHMYSLPLGVRSNRRWSEWCESLRPTTILPQSVEDVGLPLRVISCAGLIERSKIEWKKPTNWNFVIISHRWREKDPEWVADHLRPYPAAGPVTVRAVRRESLEVLARLCRAKGFRYFWIDCVCIDQKSQLEKGREIVNMADYYKNAAMTLIFPFGVDQVGPPLNQDGSAPVWHSRAWTLQEEAMSADRARFVLCLPGSISPASGKGPIMSCDVASHVNGIPGICGHRTDDDNGFLHDFAKFVDVDPTHERAHDKAYLYLVKNEDMSDWRRDYLRHVVDARYQEEGEKTIQLLEPVQDWTLWSALREMFRRQASNPEDRLYSLLGFVGVTLEPCEIKYGVGLRAALRTFIRALHFDQRLVVTVVEAYHGNFLDGFGTLPDFTDNYTSEPAPFLKHKRTLGTADFLGHEGGMQITAPSITVDLEEKCLDGDGSSIDAHPEGSSLASDPRSCRYAFIQLVQAAKRKSSIGDAWIQPGHPTLGMTLIAVTEVEFPNGEPPGHEERDGEAQVTFCCLVCTEGGSVKRKIGLALVAAASHAWTMQRHIVG